MEPRPLGFEEYRLLVEQAPILIWRANPEAKCDYFNQRWLDFTGRRLEEEIGDGWAEGVHPQDFERCLRIYLESFARRQTFEMVYRLRRHDGVYRYIFDRGVPFWDEQGRFAGYIGSCTDVSERVEAQEALQKAQDSQMNQLKGLLPICFGCNRIRDDQGRWEKLETYIEQRSQAAFSHGLCPECAQRMFPELMTDAPEINPFGQKA